MIEESYVSFETAKMLKDAGFEANLKTRYVEEEKGEWAFWELGSKRSDYNYFDDTIACPTQALAERWLREEHNLHVWCELTQYGDWFYCIDKIKPYQQYCVVSEADFKSFEESLEAGLQEAIKLIKK